MSVIDVPRAPRAPFLDRRGVAPLLIALVATAAGAAGAGVPSAWFDEAATASMVDRTDASLFATTLGQADVVHALYYFLVKHWADVAGSSVLALRLPSVGGMAAGAVLVWAVARRIQAGRYPIVAAAVYITLPTVTWAATEARSYSLDAAAATGLTLLLLRALDSGGARWVAYGVAAVVATYLFLYLALVVLAHVAALLVVPASRRPLRRVVPAAVGYLVLVLPLVAVAAHQSSQVSWIPAFGLRTAGSIALQWFIRAPLYAVPALVLLAIGVVLLARGGRAAPGRLPRRLLLSWLVLPTVVLVLVTAAGKHLYLARYLIVSAPAAALVIGLCVALTARTAVALLAVLVLLSVPSYVQQRMPFAKEYDWGLTTTQIAALQGSSTGVYFQSVYARTALHAYPEAFAGIQDVALRVTGARRDELWDTVLPAEAAAARSGGLQRLLVVSRPVNDRADRGRTLSAFEEVGFRPQRTIRGPWSTVTVLGRSG